LLGLGWNFLYVGATTLLTETYTIEERAKTQALNELLVFIVTGASIFSSGQLLYNVGWSAVNLGALPLVLLTLAATAWLWWKSPKPGPLPAETPIEAAAK
jgi:MFS family permease